MARLRAFARKLGSRILIVLASVLVTLLLLEILVRILGPQQLIILRPDIWIPVNDGRGHIHQSNLNTEINMGERTVRLVTDGEGYRVGTETTTYEPAIQILAVGDSFLEALQVDYEDSMTALLEANLSNDLSVPVRTFNTGVGGYTPNHYYVVTRQELQSREYDLAIVFVYMGNDLVREFRNYLPPRPSSNHSFHLPRNLDRDEIVDGLLYPLNDFLEKSSHLYVLFKHKARNILTRVGLTAYYLPDPIQTAYLDSPTWDLTADVFLAIQEVAAQYGVPVLFVLIPSDSQVYPDALEWRLDAFGISEETIDLDQPSIVWQRELTLRNLTFYDTTPVLREAYDQGIQDLYGRIDNHLGIGGHQTIAEAIYPIVLDQLER